MEFANPMTAEEIQEGLKVGIKNQFLEQLKAVKKIDLPIKMAPRSAQKPTAPSQKVEKIFKTEKKVTQKAKITP